LQFSELTRAFVVGDFLRSPASGGGITKGGTIEDMRRARCRGPACSRRGFLLTLPAACFAARSEKPGTLPPALYRYNDRATDFPVVRLTDPSWTSRLPAHYGRSASRHGNFLLYASDASGRMEAYRMDLKNGASLQLTEQEGLDPSSLTLAGKEHIFYCLAGGRLLSIHLGRLKVGEIYRIPDGFEPGTGMSVSEDGFAAALVERKGEHFRLRLVHLADGSAHTLAEADEEMSDPILRPRRASVLYRRGGGLWLVNEDAQQNYRLRLAAGETGPADWSPDGRTVLYLNYPADPRMLHNIREFTPDLNQDKAIADTTQFVAFECNEDASVFVGASGSKASPYVLLLVRAVKRELTLCEHRSSDPRLVAPIFAPNSQHIFFGSDQHGKPAIYALNVERLVSETDSSQ
jgi:oligogalacturonide lyase